MSGKSTLDLFSFADGDRLSGADNYVTWSRRFMLLAGRLKNGRLRGVDLLKPVKLPQLPVGATAPKVAAHEELITSYNDLDLDLIYGLMSACTDQVSFKLDKHRDSPTFGRAASAWAALKRDYAQGLEQQSYNLMRQIMDASMQPSETVQQFTERTWLLYEECTSGDPSWDMIYRVCLLSNLPSQFTAYKDGIFVAGMPSAEKLRVDVLQLANAQAADAKSTTALVAKTVPSSQHPIPYNWDHQHPSEVLAMYASMHAERKVPSAAHPCSRCGSPDHWVVTCTEPAAQHHRQSASSAKKGKKSKKAESVISAKLAIAITSYIKSTQPMGEHEPPMFPPSFHTSTPTPFPESSALLAAASSCAGTSSTFFVWFLDSGAGEMMSGDESWFVPGSLQAIPPVIVTTADDTRLKASSKGTIRLLINRECVTFSGVLFVPGLAYNLLSVRHLIRQGCQIVFREPENYDVICDGKLLLTGEYRDGGFLVVGEALPSAMAQARSSDALMAFPALLTAEDPTVEPGMMSVGPQPTWSVWHRRLCHLPPSEIKKLISAHSTGARVADQRRIGKDGSGTEMNVCVGCVHGKIHRSSFRQSASQAPSQLSLIHADLCGPMGVESVGGSQYFLVLVDDYSRYKWFFPLRRKSDAAGKFTTWLAQVERSTEKLVKVLRTDNGGEFTSKAFEKYLADLGVQHQTTLPYTSQQNGRAERQMRTIVNTGLAVLHSERLPLKFWAEIFDSVVYTLNRAVSSVTKKTPFERYFGSKPDISNLRVLGCPVWNLILKPKRSGKLSDRAHLCVMMGYLPNQKGWRLWDPVRGIMIGSADCIFDETPVKVDDAQPRHSLAELEARLTRFFEADSVPSPSGALEAAGHAADGNAAKLDTPANLPLPSAKPAEGLTDPDAMGLGQATDRAGTEAVASPECLIRRILDAGGRQRSIASSTPSAGLLSDQSDYQPPTTESDSDSDESTSDHSDSSDDPLLLTGGPAAFSALVNDTVECFTPGYLRTFAFGALVNDEVITPEYYKAELESFMTTGASPSDPNLLVYPCQIKQTAFAAKAVRAPDEINTYKQAFASPDWTDWQAALRDEMSSLQKAGVFHPVKRLPGTKVVGCRWVFAVKRDQDGNIARYKARLVAQGFSQREGIDYQETFAPVAKFQSIRLIIALACLHDLELHQMDVKTAFLYAPLEEDIYMALPEGYASLTGEDPSFEGGGTCLKLDKSIYGLKQSPRNWYRMLDGYLCSLGFQRSPCDHSVYSRQDSPGLIIVGVYVDDLTIAASQIDTLTQFKAEISSKFEMKDLGEMEYILGLQVRRNRKVGTIHLSQERYVLDVLAKFGMQDCTPTKSPMPSGVLHRTNVTDIPGDKDTYMSLVGSLMYAMLGTRPDLAFIVGLLSRFAHNPSEEHLSVAKGVLRYLRGTASLGIVYSKASPITELEGFSDADYATSDEERRRVTSGYLFKLAGGPISWNSKRQPSVTISTAEAEYVALSHASREAYWLRSLLSTLYFPPIGPTTLYGDNQASLVLALNPVGHSRIKQVDIMFHCLREYQERLIINVTHVGTLEMAADGLTKPLTKSMFLTFVKMLAMSKYEELARPKSFQERKTVAGVAHLAKTGCSGLSCLALRGSVALNKASTT